ncbi:MAG: peptidylprolyl isomerase [Gemmatimonadetes bacterium]|nr:peptidylprolyl isomerase [Gemmatimonadota bacterium]
MKQNLETTPRHRNRRSASLAGSSVFLAHGLAALLLLVAPPAEAGAQVGRDQLVDRVVAIVGDSVIVLSQVEQQVNQWRTMGRPVPEEGSDEWEDFRQSLLDELITQQIILQAATQDTLLQVDDARVEDALQQQLAQVQERFGSRAEMERVLELEGLSIQTYREMLRDQLAQEQLASLYVSRNSDQTAVEVTEEEMRDFFEAGRSSIQQRPATVTFKQVLMTAAPSDSSRADALAIIEGLLERARAGEDFAELATEYSQDPGSAQAGGDLGWFRRGNFADAFDEAAFQLLEGGISDVVETIFGYHIIIVERVRYAERKARHILIRPEVGPGDILRARQRAQEVADRAQTEDFQALIDEFHDSSLPDSATVPQRQVAQILAPAYVAALSGREAGETVGPMQFNERGQEYFAVLRIIETREAGEYTYDDFEPQIRSTLMQQKRLEALLARLRAKTYVRQIN